MIPSQSVVPAPSVRSAGCRNRNAEPAIPLGLDQHLWVWVSVRVARRRFARFLAYAWTTHRPVFICGLPRPGFGRRRDEPFPVAARFRGWVVLVPIRAFPHPRRPVRRTRPELRGSNRSRPINDRRCGTKH